jgi:hypothetical protein
VCRISQTLGIVWASMIRRWCEEAEAAVTNKERLSYEAQLFRGCKIILRKFSLKWAKLN